MKKTLILLLFSSVIIISGCSAKSEENKSEVSKTAVAKIAENNNDTADEVKTGINEVTETAASNDRSDEIQAPNFKLATLDGDEFYLSDFNGKVVLLNFWGTWCPPCRKEIPDLINLQKKYNDDGLEIVGITLNSGSAADIKKFVNDKEINYTVLTDFNNSETQQVTYLYGQTIGQQISSIPTTLVIDREGFIVKGYLGPRSEEVFYNDLKEYL